MERLPKPLVLPPVGMQTMHSDLFIVTCTTRPSTVIMAVTSLIYAQLLPCTKWRPMLTPIHSEPQIMCLVLSQTCTWFFCTHGCQALMHAAQKTTSPYSIPFIPFNLPDDPAIFKSSDIISVPVYICSLDESFYTHLEMWITPCQIINPL